MYKFFLLSLLFFILLFDSASLYAKDDNLQQYKYIQFPKAYNKWQCVIMPGISVAKLPVIISENEISRSPLLLLDVRLGLPYNISSTLQLNTNYISNLAAISFGWTFLNESITLAAGGKISGWYGQLELDSENFSSRGWILSPFVKAGMSFDEIFFSVQLESMHSRYYTYSENEFLGIVRDPGAGLTCQFTLEQPFWNDNWVLLAIRLNYSKFFYQSWLSYSTIDDYLIYPEIIFGFIL